MAKKHNTRAAGATALFALFGIASVLVFPPDWNTAWPLIIFYALLVWNTYYSIAFFSSIITPHHTSQRIVDGVLVVLYFLLALHFGKIEFFAIMLTLLFSVATIKYAITLGSIDHHVSLYPKIIADVLGIIMATLAILGVALGYSYATSLALLIIFAIAHVYVLYIKPLYKIAS